MFAGVLTEAAAQEAIGVAWTRFAPQFREVIRVLNAHPELRPSMRGRSRGLVSEAEYLRHLAARFAEAREPRSPEPPATVPDQLVGHVLESYFGIAKSDLARINETHQLSMAAENIVGDLLERYIASVLEPRGWAWCAGSTVRSVDFVRPASRSEPLILLQVKNRDNSENSSSSAVRDGTPIVKWFRAFSRRQASNWDAFPDPHAAKLLSEGGFVQFSRRYLATLRDGAS